MGSSCSFLMLFSTFSYSTRLRKRPSKGLPTKERQRNATEKTCSSSIFWKLHFRMFSSVKRHLLLEQLTRNHSKSFDQELTEAHIFCCQATKMMLVSGYSCSSCGLRFKESHRVKLWTCQQYFVVIICF